MQRAGSAAEALHGPSVVFWTMCCFDLSSVHTGSMISGYMITCGTGPIRCIRTARQTAAWRSKGAQRVRPPYPPTPSHQRRASAAIRFDRIRIRIRTFRRLHCRPECEPRGWRVTASGVSERTVRPPDLRRLLCCDFEVQSVDLNAVSQCALYCGTVRHAKTQAATPKRGSEWRHTA